jgi:hypothetical protein
MSKLSSMTRPTGLGAKVAAAVWPVMTEKESTVKPIAIARRPTRKIELNDSGAVTKISSESCTEFISLRRGRLCLRQTHNDPQWLIGRELSRPAHNEFLCFFVEILFAEWKGIQAMKELGDFFNPNLDRGCGCRPLFTYVPLNS